MSRRGLGAIVALAAVIGLSLTWASLSAGQGADVAAVQGVVLDVLHAEHELANLPAAASQTGVSASLRGQMAATARSTISRLYSGPIIDARMATLVAGIEVEGTPDGVFVWDGGVRDASFKSTVIDGETAVAIVTTTTYLVMSPTIDGARAAPENRGTYTFKLAHIHGQWFVTDEDVSYASGQGP